MANDRSRDITRESTGSSSFVSICRLYLFDIFSLGILPWIGKEVKLSDSRYGDWTH